MKDTTKQTIIDLAAKNSFTFYAPVAQQLGVKGKTAERYLRELEKAGILVSKDDGEHAVTFELSKDAQEQYNGAAQLVRISR